MLFAGTGETGMVHEVSGAVVVNERGIVAWETSMFALSLPLHWIELIRRSPMSLCQLLPMALVEIAVLPASSTYGPVMSLERNMRIW